MDDQDDSSPASDAPTCPHCMQAVDAELADSDGLLTCPRCNSRFSPPAADQQPFAIDDSEEMEAEAPPQEELNSRRIRQISKVHRGASRNRSYCLVAAIATLVMAVQLGWMTYSYCAQNHAWGWRPTAYALSSLVMLRWAWNFNRKAAHYHEESLKSELPEPTKPPDFGPLSDGSQRFRNLDEL